MYSMAAHTDQLLVRFGKGKSMIHRRITDTFTCGSPIESVRFFQILRLRDAMQLFVTPANGLIMVWAVIMGLSANY